MKKPTAVPFLRPNKKGHASITVRYTYNRERHPFPIGHTIVLSDWDSKRNRVNYHVSGSTEINNKIKKVITDLEFLSNKLIEEGKAPTIVVMKEAYQALQDIRIEEEERRINNLNSESNRLNREFEYQYTTYNDTQKEITKLQKKLENRKTILKGMYSHVEIWKPELEELLKERKDLELDAFNENLKKTDLITQLNIIDAPDIETNEELNKRSQFLKLLNEYIEESTGVSLNASIEEIKAVKKAATGTNKGLRSWAKTLQEFTKSKYLKKVNFQIDLENNLGQRFYDTYAHFLQSPLSEGGKNYYNATFGAHIRKLKTFFKWVELDKQISIDRRYSRFKVLNEEKEIIALTIEDIDLLYNWTPPISRTHADANDWRKYIDFTVFSFLTSLRISDIKRVKGFRIENGYIIGKTKKTGGNFKVPMALDQRIKEILDRYNGDMLLFSDVEYNRRIKILLKMFFEAYNLYEKPITISRKKYIYPAPIETTHQFYDLYTSHCNRRGWVSWMSDSGFDDSTNMEIMGTKSIQEYLKYKKNKVSHLTDTVTRVLSAQSQSQSLN